MHAKSHKNNSLLRLCVTALVFFATSLSTFAHAQTAPALPLATVNIAYALPGGSRISVQAGGDLQAAIDLAKPGDVIVVQAGATFVGPIVLPKKSGDGWIYIQTSAYQSLPPPGKRVAFSDAAFMPKIVAGPADLPALTTVSGAHHFRLVGIQFTAPANEYRTAIVSIGNGETDVAALPNNLILDRVFIRPDAAKGGRRGIAMNGAAIAVIDSIVADFKEVNADSQAVWASNTPGPLAIVNNLLEGAGENFLIGGSDPTISNVIPSDVVIRGNTFHKPLAWLNQNWTVKNSLEFKAGRRILVEGNLFENNWIAGQAGFVLVITPRNQDGGAPWTKISDVTVRLNKFVNVAQGVNVLGTDNIHPTQLTERVLFRDNVFLVNGLVGNGSATGATTGQARIFQILDGPRDVWIDHNTAIHLGGSDRVIAVVENSRPPTGFSFTNNIVTKGDYGFSGVGSPEGRGALDGHFNAWIFEKNALVGAAPSLYPAGNFFPAALSAVQFVDSQSGNYRLRPTSPFVAAAADGSDLGANIPAVEGALAGQPVQLVPAAPKNMRVR